jgi:diguanylate cyclase (GGDEF)-like protein
MKEIIEGLAGMSGLRDRDALDFELVRLIVEASGGTVTSSSLMLVVGDVNDQRCFTRAKLVKGSTRPERDPVWIDWSTLPRLVEFPRREQALQTNHTVTLGANPSVSVFPLGVALGASGFLEIESNQTLPEFVLELIRSILKAYQNVLGLLDYGEKDALTELLNRKTFDGAFFKATAGQRMDYTGEFPDRRLDNDGAEYWLAVLDIDHFKRVNDTFGHLIGDEVLLLMARLMRANFRFHDQLYRFGGEEFVILMRCFNLEEAQSALERLRLAVQSHTFPQVGSITVSIGFTVLIPNDTPGGAFGRADKAVYHAKAHGRNQVCSYQALIDSGDLVEEKAEEMDIDLF